MARVAAIDYWCNPFTPALLPQLFLGNDEFRAVVEWWHMEDRVKGHDTPSFLRLLDEAGFEEVYVPSVQVWSYQKRAPLWDVSIETIAALRREAPDRIQGLYGINPFRKMNGVRELEAAIREHGFRGAHLHPYGFGVPINDRLLYPYYAKCVELDVPVVMQVGHSAESMPSAVARPILLDDVALDFPDLRIVAAHTGWPWVEELVALAWKHPNLYIGTSAHAPKYWDPSLVRFIKGRGRGKVLFGTDFPVLLHAESRAQAEALNLGAEAEAALFRETARKVFRR